MLKCYPCIRGCGYVKGAFGAVLILVALWMVASMPVVLDCIDLRTSCAPAFGSLTGRLSRVPGSTTAVNEYCDCWLKCLNYMLVYAPGEDKTVKSADLMYNCYRGSAKAGIRNLVSSAYDAFGMQDRAEELQEPPPKGGVLTLASSTCVSCQEAAEDQDTLFFMLAGLGGACGVALIVTSGCEHLEIKFHSTLFSYAVLVTDFVCFVLLAAATALSLGGVALGVAACDPEQFQAAMEWAGRKSTDGDKNKAAEYANFLVLLLQPMASNICRTRSMFGVFAMVSVLGVFCTIWSVMATLLLCMNCTDDGDYDHKDDHNANQMHQLLKPWSVEPQAEDSPTGSSLGDAREQLKLWS